MLYALDKKTLRAWSKSGVFLPEFKGAEMLRVVFQTDPKVIAKILPKPLTPTRKPLGLAFVARYRATNFGVSYDEGALFVNAAYKGEIGKYCLSMPVTNDMAMIGGRERYGFPKKMADAITLERDGGHVVGSVVRHGAELMHLEAELTDEVDLGAPDPAGVPWTKDSEGRDALKAVSFLFKFFPAASGSGFEDPPRLIRQVTLFRPRLGLKGGTGKLELGGSTADPLGEIPVRDVLTATYGVYDTTMLPARRLVTVRNPLRFAPYAFFSTDTLGVLDPTDRPKLSRRKRRKLERKLASY